MDLIYNREEGKVVLCQGHLVSEIPKRFVMDACKPSPTPMENKWVLHPHADGEGVLTDSPYRSLARSVMYLMLFTRSDVSDSVGVLSRLLSKHREEHGSAQNDAALPEG